MTLYEDIIKAKTEENRQAQDPKPLDEPDEVMPPLGNPPTPEPVDPGGIIPALGGFTF